LNAPDPQPPTEWRRRFPGAWEEIGPCLAWIESISKGLHLADDRSYAILLCAEELVSNIVRHNRAPDAGTPLRIAVCLGTRPGGVALTIEDNGVAFDVVNAPATEIATSIDGLAPGGLGITLVKRFASSLRYTRRANLNCIVAEFVDASATPAAGRE
jgi:anti-sigma regulatory factor (Ser/Thr protein kinase)